MRNVLITNDEVIFHAPTKHTLDPRTIQQAIIIAEERFIRPALGDAFYEELCDAKNVVVTSGNVAALRTASGISSLAVGDILNAWEQLDADGQILWKKFLWKLCAEAVMLMATPDAFMQFASEGVVLSAPPASPLSGGTVTSPSLATVKWMMDKKLMDRIDPLIASMHGWLCKNISDYPGYLVPCACEEDGIATLRKTDIVFGMYDDDDNDRNCCR